MTIRTREGTEPQSIPALQESHFRVVPRPVFPTSEPASTQLLSESGQKAIVAEVPEAAAAATCREKLPSGPQLPSGESGCREQPWLGSKGWAEASRISLVPVLVTLTPQLFWAVFALQIRTC